MTASITSVIAKAKNSNNGRIVGLAMTETEKTCARKAVKRGLMTMHFMFFPGFGLVPAFQIVAKA